MVRKQSSATKDKIIEAHGKRGDLVRAAERYRAALQTIVDVYDMRSELCTSDEELAANLYDRARIALSPSED